MSDENKLVDNTTDPELDELLDSALQDFDKLSNPIAAKDDPPTTSNSQKVGKIVEKEAIDETWSQDFIKHTAVQFEKNIQGLLQNGTGGEFEESLQKMAQSVASAMSSGSGTDAESDGNEFQAAIAQALKDLSATSENLQNAPSAVSEADLAAMFGQTSLDDSTGDFLPFMQGMMQSLLSKEILYPSLKELVDKYPDWLENNKATLSNTDFERFTKHLELMQKVCTELEKEKDNDVESVKKQRFDKILSLMHEMQSYGQPPADLVGEQQGMFQLDGEGNAKLPPGVDPQNCSVM